MATTTRKTYLSVLISSILASSVSFAATAQQQENDSKAEEDVEEPQRTRDLGLHLGVRVGVEETDSDGLHTRAAHALDEACELGSGGTLGDLERASGRRVGALSHLEAPPTVNEGCGLGGVESVELGAVLAADLDEVAEALVRDEGGGGDVAGEHRVQAHGGAVDELDPGRVPEGAEAGEHRLRGVLGG